MHKTHISNNDIGQVSLPMVAFSNALISLSETIISVMHLFFRRLRVYIKALRLANDRRRTTATLNGLSDHVLRDIGVSRYGIHNFVKHNVR